MKYMPSHNFWFTENDFVLAWFKRVFLLNLLNVKSKHLGWKFKYFIYYLLVRRFPKTRITREQKENIFWLIKNEDKIVSDLLRLYFYYINNEQELVVKYLELIFTRIKTKRLKVAELSKIAYLQIEGKKDCLCRD